VPDPTYEERYCAFVDVLGFTELLKEFGHPDRYTRLRDILAAIHNPRPSPFVERFEGSDLRAQSISDAVCISASASAPGLLHLLSAIHFLTLDVLWEGFLVRGAVVKDHLYHDTRMVFGPALVRAYNLETNVAKYPRVMLTSDVVKDCNKFAEDALYTEAFENRVVQSDDGPYFLDYFWEIRDVMEHGGWDSGETLDKYEGMALTIQTNVQKSFDVPAHFEKQKWIANYWNRVTAGLGLTVIEGPGIVHPEQPDQKA
jgi:hypothetical protein